MQKVIIHKPNCTVVHLVAASDPLTAAAIVHSFDKKKGLLKANENGRLEPTNR